VAQQAGSLGGSGKVGNQARQWGGRALQVAVLRRGKAGSACGSKMLQQWQAVGKGSKPRECQHISGAVGGKAGVGLNRAER